MTGEDATVTAPPDGHKPLSHSPKSAKKRDAILRAATEIINVKGYALATMTEIAAALDLRDAALYYYFPNKQALVFACHQSSLERFRAGAQRDERRQRRRLRKTRTLPTGAARGIRPQRPLLYFGDRSYLDEDQRDAIAACSEHLTRRLERIIQDGMDDRLDHALRVVAGGPAAAGHADPGWPSGFRPSKASRSTDFMAAIGVIQPARPEKRRTAGLTLR